MESLLDKLVRSKRARRFATVVGAGVRFVSLLILVSADVYAQSLAGDRQDFPQQTFMQAVLRHFDNLDFDHNGTINAGEINRALRDGHVRGEAAVVAATLKVSRDLHLPPLTRQFFASNNRILADLATAFLTCSNRLSESTNLPLFSPDGPSFAGCKQEGFGDCGLIAPIGGNLARDRQSITRMVAPDPTSGGFAVSFPDGVVVKVSNLTDGELAWLGVPTPKNGTWIRVLEKAWGIRVLIAKGVRRLDAEPFDQLWVPTGMKTLNAMEAMTGHTYATYRLGCNSRTDMGPTISVSDVRQLLQSSINRGRLAGLGSPHSTPMPPGLSNHHAYAIVAYDSRTDQVTIWNPNANDFSPNGPASRQFGYSTVDGLFSMPLADMRASFFSLSIETDQPALQ